MKISSWRLLEPSNRRLEVQFRKGKVIQARKGDPDRPVGRRRVSRSRLREEKNPCSSGKGDSESGRNELEDLSCIKMERRRIGIHQKEIEQYAISGT